MYKILIHNIENKYEYDELIKVFLQPDQFRTFTDSSYEDGSIYENPSLPEADYDEPSKGPTLIVFNEADFGEKDHIKREIYQGLSQLTGLTPAWGILTGVRPVKLTGELFRKLKDREAVRRKLCDYYLVSEEKAALLIDTYEYQQEVLGPPPSGGIGVYIGIPFCPTRCLYCSFTSNQKGPEEIQRYLDCLFTEIRYCGLRMRQTGLWPESVYIGGGTPTTLDPDQLDQLLSLVKSQFDLSRTREFTVEAGRPDTITCEKLEVLKKHGVRRISINPQSMKARTLELIGRSHSPSDIVKAFQRADWMEIGEVNADLIAGLPEETPEDFGHTLDQILRLDPENITVHTLAVKRASRLIDVAPDYHYRQAEVVSEMLAIARAKLADAGYRPYYLYRQKHMAGAFENVGYCKDDTPCIYNIRIMEEQQSILALGAGGISKIYFPEENRLERVPNVSNYEVYIQRIEEMLNRKEQNFFKEVGEC